MGKNEENIESPRGGAALKLGLSVWSTSVLTVRMEQAKREGKEKQPLNQELPNNTVPSRMIDQ